MVPRQCAGLIELASAIEARGRLGPLTSMAWPGLLTCRTGCCCWYQVINEEIPGPQKAWVTYVKDRKNLNGGAREGCPGRGLPLSSCPPVLLAPRCVAAVRG